MTTTSKRATLRKKLVRLAFENPSKRADILPMVAKLAGDKMPKELLDKFKAKGDKKAADETANAAKMWNKGYRYSIAFPGGKPATLYAKTMAQASKLVKENYPDVKADIKKMAEPNKKASVNKAAGKDMEAFGRWVLSTQSPMNPSEVEAIVNRTFGVKTSPPKPSTKGLPRWQRGDSVIVNASKHKLKKYDKANYERFDGKIGTVTEIDGVDVMLALPGERADVRFPGGMSKSRVGLQKYVKPFTVTGGPMMEMYYIAGGAPSKDQRIVVDVYLSNGRKEKRSSQYYTGSVILASTGGNGWYFKANPQQRISVDPMKQGRYETRTFNPAIGQVLYLGILGRRPPQWKEELKKLDDLNKVDAEV